MLPAMVTTFYTPSDVRHKKEAAFSTDCYDAQTIWQTSPSSRATTNMIGKKSRSIYIYQRTTWSVN